MNEQKRELLVVRHTSVDVPQGVCYGGSDVGLQATFPEEARLVQEKLSHYTPDLVLSSPLSRATKLANEIGYRDVITDDRLREQHFGAWEMQKFDEIDDPQLLKWFEDYVYERPTDGESFADVVKRVGQLIDELREGSQQKILIFAHGGIQMAVGAYLGLYEMIEAPNHFQGYGSVMKYQL